MRDACAGRGDLPPEGQARGISAQPSSPSRRQKGPPRASQPSQTRGALQEKEPRWCPAHSGQRSDSTIAKVLSNETTRRLMQSTSPQARGRARSPPLPSAGAFRGAPDSCTPPAVLGTAGSDGDPRQRQDVAPAPRQDAAGLRGLGPGSPVLPGRFFKPLSHSHNNCASVLV